jgi:hypothetical protein
MSRDGFGRDARNNRPEACATPNIHYDVEDLQADLRTLAALNDK